MTRRANRLTDLDVDEVSSVDVPANQLGLIAIAKSLNGTTTEEGGMTAIYDVETGEALSVDQLSHGDVVRDEAGNELVWIEDEAPEATDDEVGKGLGAPKLPKFLAPKARATRGVGVGGGGAVTPEVRKSLGDQVLVALSKAVTDEERNDIISKALQRAAETEERLDQVEKALEAERDQRLTEAFISKAAEYNLPVPAPTLGVILKKAATVLDEDELDVLDGVLTAAGDSIYEERGFTGGSSNSIFDQVAGTASELVGKSAGAFGLEEATVAVFDANPDAYAAFLNEKG